MSGRLRSACQAFVCAVTLAVFWLACVSTVRPHELLLGAIAVAFSTAFAMYVIHTLPLHFRPTLAQLAQAWRLPWEIAADTLIVTGVLLRDLFGQRAPSLFRSAPWRWRGDSGHDAAARTLAVALSTASPNLIIVGIDRKRGQMLFHQLQKTSLSETTRRLGAEE